MLKLVVSDLDGTLLNSENELPAQIISTIEELKQKNILFAVASGRKICELKKFFNEVSNDIIFISCDGAYVTYKNRVLVKETISKDILNRLRLDAEKLSDADGGVVKVILKKEDITEREEEYIKINRLLSCVYDDYEILEFVKYGVNKGTALKKVLEIFGIDKNEVIAFGDNYNDIQMLKMIPKSFAMESGKLEVKRICRYRTNNVCKSIEEFSNRDGGLI